MAADIPGLISAIAGALADQPEAIEVTEVSRGRRQIVRLQVASERNPNNLIFQCRTKSRNLEAGVYQMRFQGALKFFLFFLLLT